MAQQGIFFSSDCFTVCIGVAPISQYTHVRNKKSNTQGNSPNVVKVISHTKRNCSLREVPI